MKLPMSVTFRVIPMKYFGKIILQVNGVGERQRRFLVRIIGNCKIPRSPYRATYTIDPRGKIKLNKAGCVDGYSMCPLPRHWRNVRLTRTVQVL